MNAPHKSRPLLDMALVVLALVMLAGLGYVLTMAVPAADSEATTAPLADRPAIAPSATLAAGYPANLPTRPPWSEGYPADLPTSQPWTEMPTPIEPTQPPIATAFPTPVVTPIPLASPPLLQLPLLPEAKYSLLVRNGNVIEEVNTEDGIQTALAVLPENTSLRLSEAFSGRTGPWASAAPDGLSLAIPLAERADGDDTALGNGTYFNLYLLDLETGEFRRLVERATDPAWSPDSTRIAYEDATDGSLWVIEVASGVKRELFAANPPGDNFYRAAGMIWSPAGDRIAFVKAIAPYGEGELWMVAADGQEPAQPAIDNVEVAGPLQWSPLGDQIQYVSNAGESDTPDNLLHLWLYTIATGEARQLTRNFFAVNAAWSPAGQHIIFSGIAKLEGPERPYDLWAVSVADGTITRLTNDPANDLDPTWPPGQSRIVYRRPGEGIWELDVVSGLIRNLYPTDIDFVVLPKK